MMKEIKPTKNQQLQPPVYGQVVEAAAGAMRSVMDRLSRTSCEAVSGISREDLKLIFEAGVRALGTCVHERLFLILTGCI